MAGAVLSVNSGGCEGDHFRFSVTVYLRQPTAGATTGTQVEMAGTYNNTTGSAKRLGCWLKSSTTTTYQLVTGTSMGANVSSDTSFDTGWVTSSIAHGTGNTTFTILVQVYDDGGTYYYSKTMTVTGKIYWTSGGGGGSTPYSSVGAPTSVKVGATSTHSSNSTVYNVATPTPGLFYQTWTAGTNGTNTTVNGYTSKRDGTAYGGSVYTTDHVASSRSCYSSGWSASAAGKTYKCTVMTKSSPSGYDSAYSSAYGSVVFSASVVNQTITANGNGGAPTTTTRTGARCSTVDLPTPTRSHYDFGGWYWNSTTTNYLNYTNAVSYTTNFTISLWTYATSYDQGSSSTCCSIVSAAEGGGFDFVNETGTYWEWQVYSSGWKKCQLNKSQVTPGYHTWCLVADTSNKIARMYMDGVQKATTTLGTTSVGYGSTKNTILGAQLASNGGMLSNTGFNGYIGNFNIVNSVENNAAVDLNTFMVPTENITVYAYWTAKPTYTVSYNANGGSSTPSSQTKYEGEALTLRAAISKASTVTPVTTTYTTTFNVNGGATSTPSALTNKKTVTTTQPYSFNKWAAGSTTGTQYAASGTYLNDATTTMYALWTNGTATTTTATTSITLPTYTLKANYYDGDPGWYTAASGGTKKGNAGDSLTPTSSSTLYLHPWKCCYVYKSGWKKALPYVYKSGWKRSEPYVFKSSWK